MVKFFGENSKTTPPSVFFPVFVRFVRAYRVSWITVTLTHFDAFWCFKSLILQKKEIHFKHVKSPQQAEEDNEQRKRQEQIMLEKLLEQEAMMEEDQKVRRPPCFSACPRPLLSRAGVYVESQ